MLLKNFRIRISCFAVSFVQSKYFVITYQNQVDNNDDINNALKDIADHSMYEHKFEKDIVANAIVEEVTESE